MKVWGEAGTGCSDPLRTAVRGKALQKRGGSVDLAAAPAITQSSPAQGHDVASPVQGAPASALGSAVRPQHQRQQGEGEGDDLLATPVSDQKPASGSSGRLGRVDDRVVRRLDVLEGWSNGAAAGAVQEEGQQTPRSDGHEASPAGTAAAAAAASPSHIAGQSPGATVSYHRRHHPDASPSKKLKTEESPVKSPTSGGARSPAAQSPTHVGCGECAMEGPAQPTQQAVVAVGGGSASVHSSPRESLSDRALRHTPGYPGFGLRSRSKSEWGSFAALHCT